MFLSFWSVLYDHCPRITYRCSYNLTNTDGIHMYVHLTIFSRQYTLVLFNSKQANGRSCGPIHNTSYGNKDNKPLGVRPWMICFLNPILQFAFSSRLFSPRVVLSAQSWLNWSPTITFYVKRYNPKMNVVLYEITLRSDQSYLWKSYPWFANWRIFLLFADTYLYLY